MHGTQQSIALVGAWSITVSMLDSTLHCMHHAPLPDVRVISLQHYLNTQHIVDLQSDHPSNFQYCAKLVLQRCNAS